MNISVVETNHGQKSIIWDGNRYKLDETENRRYFLAMGKVQTTWQSLEKNRKMSIHTHRMSKPQRGSTSNLEPRRRHQKTHVLGHLKSYAVKSLSWLTKGHQFTGIQVIRSKGYFPFRSNVLFAAQMSGVFGSFVFSIRSNVLRHIQDLSCLLLCFVSLLIKQ